jgi:hypothetical protein
MFIFNCNAECHYAECRFADCHGALFVSEILNVAFIFKNLDNCKHSSLLFKSVNYEKKVYNISPWGHLRQLL